MKKYTHIVWDWNGTLLDDLRFCIDVQNGMLAERGLPTMDSVAAYHSVFCFPIIQYYRNIGYDFERESFEDLAAIYMARYHSDAYDCALFSDAEGMLKKISESGMRQIILSASKKEHLEMQLEPFDILRYLDGVYGIGDHYAAGKKEIATHWVSAERIPVETTLFIGDSVHDCEVAESVGAGCILIARGHQSEAQLRATGARVVASIDELDKILF